MEKLFEYYRKLVRETDIEFYRYIYSKINWNSRMIEYCIYRFVRIGYQ